MPTALGAAPVSTISPTSSDARLNVLVNLPDQAKRAGGSQSSTSRR